MESSIVTQPQKKSPIQLDVTDPQQFIDNRHGMTQSNLTIPVYEAEALQKIWAITKPEYRFIQGDCRKIPLNDSSVDLIVTSPPYWRKRDYGHPDQIGQEKTPEEYAENIGTLLEECRRILSSHGNIFLNIGDTYYNKSLAGIPALLEIDARKRGFKIRNRIIWAKKKGMPEPARDRLANRHEYILHFSRNGYYYDLYGYCWTYGNGANLGDVWYIKLLPNRGDHLAPYPIEIVERAITAACPPLVNIETGKPVRRIVGRTMQLDPNRPQARRAVELAKKHNLTIEHIGAIQSSGITDAGKAREIQNGVDKNAPNVRRLAAEAKKVLGGYYREFTFARKSTVGWDFDPNGQYRRGVIFDPFLGTGTTVCAAHQRGLTGIGIDIKRWKELQKLKWLRGESYFKMRTF